jgi:hypothetical protein
MKMDLCSQDVWTGEMQPSETHIIPIERHPQTQLPIHRNSQRCQRQSMTQRTIAFYIVILVSLEIEKTRRRVMKLVSSVEIWREPPLFGWARSSKQSASGAPFKRSDACVVCSQPYVRFVFLSTCQFVCLMGLASLCTCSALCMRNNVCALS